MKGRISSGNQLLDELLAGGYETDIVTTIYGPSSAGKTNICLLAAVEMAKTGKKVIYIDTEGGFSIERLSQLTKNTREILKNILFLKPTTFEGQKKAFQKLKALVDDKIGLIVVDTIAMLYRYELGKSDAVYEVNRELGSQISYLSEIARKKKIPVILANQVYSGMDNSDKVKMVGGDIIKYTSKCLLELKKYKGSLKSITLKKHRSIREGREILFKIVEEGIVPADSNI